MGILPPYSHISWTAIIWVIHTFLSRETTPKYTGWNIKGTALPLDVQLNMALGLEIDRIALLHREAPRVNKIIRVSNVLYADKLDMKQPIVTCSRLPYSSTATQKR